VRPVAQQPTVLDRRGLALLAVRDDDGPGAEVDPVVAHGPQLRRHREAGATTAEQPAAFDVAEQRVGIV
jgi:hypothetical protein